MGKRYPQEFRNDVVKLATKRDADYTQLAKDFGISEASIYNWVKQADIDNGNRAGMTATEAQELRDLKKRNRVLEEENQILRRAAAFFAKDISPK